MENMITRLEIVDIRTDGNTQSRVEIAPNVCADYAEAMLAGDEFPPITVFSDGEHFWLADGFHRLSAAKANKLNSIQCDVREGTIRDAQLFAVGANAQHGIRRSNADKRAAVKRLLNDPEWSAWSDREIARRCKVDHKSVSSLRPSSLGNSPVSRTYTTKHGTTSQMATSNIGSAPKPVDRQNQTDRVTHPDPEVQEKLDDGYAVYDNKNNKWIDPLSPDERQKYQRQSDFGQNVIDICESVQGLSHSQFRKDVLPEDQEDVGRALAEATTHLVEASSIWRNTYGQNERIE